jgi:hypothetical protein
LNKIEEIAFADLLPLAIPFAPRGVIVHNGLIQKPGEIEETPINVRRFAIPNALALIEGLAAD